MYTVEFESDASVVTTLDQSELHEDVEMIYTDGGVVYIRQYEPITESYNLIYMSHQQWYDLLAGYRSPEGSYYLTNKKKGDKADGYRG
tara:strand:+ start:66 stop:329 length:264 start_codon:yes stop_codon:yes gene_type:complete